MSIEKSFDNYTNKNQDVTGQENLTQFLGFKTDHYYEPFNTGRAFIFMTKPFLFLNPLKPGSSNLLSYDYLAYQNMCKDPYFSLFLITESSSVNDNLIIKSLSYKEFPNDIKSLFLPAITNKAKGFDPADTVLETFQAFDTKQQLSMNLPTFTTTSEASGNFTISVSESNNLDFIKMISLWVKYINNVSDGTFNANPEMIKNGVVDYMSSLYYFVLDSDGRTLKYWAKYTGCYPTAIPYGSLRSQKGEVSSTELDIPFVYTIKEDMNPAILEDFNRISLRITDFSFENNRTDENSIYSFSEGLDHYSYTGSQILSKKKLSEAYHNLLNSDDRDPIVFYNDVTSQSILVDSKNKKFELSFNNKTLTDSFFVNKLQDEESYSFNYNGAKINF